MGHGDAVHVQEFAPLSACVVQLPLTSAGAPIVVPLRLPQALQLNQCIADSHLHILFLIAGAQPCSRDAGSLG